MNMVSRNTVLAVTALLGCLALQASATVVDDVLCHDWQHHTFGGGVSCCNHKTVHPGISENLEYKEWQDAPKDDKENLTASTWRVYTHLLEKSLPKGEKTISLTKFANIMSKSYPAKVKTDISNAVEKAKKDAKKKAFADAEIELTDYANINRMRVTYFNIEKLSCGKFPKNKKAEPEIDMWANCNNVEEMSHRDGACCKNITLPFYDHHHQDSYHKFHLDTCNNTLAPLAKKLKITAADDIDTLSTECQFTCFLLEKKHIKMDDVLGMKADTKMPTDKIVKLLAPIYLSKTTLKYMKDYVNKHFDMKNIMKQIPDTILGEKVKVDDILPCYAYDVVSHLIGNSLHEYCFPEEPHQDF